MPKLVDADDQRRQIREAARRAFARRGVAATGLAHVAEEAGMGRSSLYHYYPDKASLVGDLVKDLLRVEAALFTEALAKPGPPLERIEGLTRLLAGLYGEWAVVGRMLFDLRTREARRFRPFFRRIRADLAALVAEGQERGEIDRALDPEIAAALVVGVIDGLLLQALVDPRAFRDPAALQAALVVSIQKVLAP